MKKWSKRKWLEAPLNFVEIKNPLGSFQTNPQANAWWVVVLIFLKNTLFSILCDTFPLTMIEMLREVEVTTIMVILIEDMLI